MELAVPRHLADPKLLSQIIARTPVTLPLTSQWGSQPGAEAQRKEAMVDSTGATRDLASCAQALPRDTTVLAPDKVNDDTPCRDTEETLSQRLPKQVGCATEYIDRI